MQNYKELTVWQKSHLLVLHVYELSKSFPKEEVYGITSQLRRCSVSVPANIAEGCENIPMETRRGSFKYHWDHYMRRNIIYCYQKT